MEGFLQKGDPFAEKLTGLRAVTLYPSHKTVFGPDQLYFQRSPLIRLQTDRQPGFTILKVPQYHRSDLAREIVADQRWWP